MFKEIYLNDDQYFELFIGKRVLKSEIFNNNGKIPLYSANVFEPFGFVDKSNIVDITHDYILWGIDGDFKFNLIKKSGKLRHADKSG